MQPPGSELLGFEQAREVILIEELIAYFAVHALREAVFHGFARIDVMPFDMVFLRPA
jgi:hypothetical protein